MTINKMQMESIRNLMDDEKADQANLTCEENNNVDFIKEYLKLDPDFEDVLKSEFSINADEL